MVLANSKTHDIYFEVNKKYKRFVSSDASPFLASALGIAMKQGEGIEIKGSISQELESNVSKIENVIKSWGSEFKPISLTAKTSRGLRKGNKVACFFSGGADSFFTYLKNKKRIKYFIFVHGFDIKVRDVNLFKQIKKNIAAIAKSEQVELIEVKTNLREVLDHYFDWDQSHEFAIAAVALFMRNGFKQIYLSCGQADPNEPHHYLTPELDILWSTENMTLVHYGCNADKISKLKFLSKNKLVMNNLRVCWVNKNKTYNCGECSKCFRNMLALYASGSLDKCKAFGKDLNLAKLKRTRIDPSEIRYFSVILEVLDRNQDVSKVRFALEDCIKFNIHPRFIERLVRAIRDSIGRFDKNYNQQRLFWYLSAKGII